MPKGPQGQWRPPDPVACAVHVAKIATGEIEETFEPPAARREATAAAGRKGGAARAKTLTPERRREIASAGAAAREGRTS